MWMVYNMYGEELCGAENENQAKLLARLYEHIDMWQTRGAFKKV